MLTNRTHNLGVETCCLHCPSYRYNWNDKVQNEDMTTVRCRREKKKCWLRIGVDEGRMAKDFYLGEMM